jgi:ribonuclease BN (tRNA processing enzyme)
VLQGVRGSSCAPGPDFLRVGGNTSCLAVTPAGADTPTLLLDAGTGLSSFGRQLNGTPFRGEILLTHLHWDHVQGLPFFTAGDRDDAEVTLRLPAQNGARADSPGSAAHLLARAMSPPHFPIGPDGLRGAWSFEALEEGTFKAGGCTVTALEVPHKGGRTFGYRVECDGKVLAYLPDHRPDIDPGAGLALSEGADVLCHGAMFSDRDRDLAHLFGHATLGEVAALAREARVGKLVLVHHAPARTDDEVEAMARELPADVPPVVVGREGDEVMGQEGAG